MNITINQNTINDMWLQFKMDSFGYHLPFALIVGYTDNTISQIPFKHNISIQDLLTELNKIKDIEKCNKEQFEIEVLLNAKSLIK